MHNVPYRFMKTFRGSIIDGARQYEDSFRYFVRPLDGTVENDMSLIETYLREQDFLKRATVGGAGMKLLDEDPYCFLVHPPMAV